jgi:hypothetical protein
MRHNNTTPPAKNPAMNRHQRRMLEACTRKNTPYSHHKNTPLGGNVSSGFGFVSVASDLILAMGKKS